MSLAKDIGEIVFGFPRKYIPRHGPQYGEEEVIDIKERMAGNYDASIIPNMKCTYFDKTELRHYEIEFKDGVIRLIREWRIEEEGSL